MTTYTDDRQASAARQARAQASADHERAARLAQHRLDYLRSLDPDTTDPVELAYHRDRWAGAHHDYLRACEAVKEANAGGSAATLSTIAAVDFWQERAAARQALADAVGASTLGELRDALARRGLEL